MFILILLWVENGFNGNNKELEAYASVAGTRTEWGFRQFN